MSWGAVAGAAIGVVGGAISSNSAKKAAGSAAGASDQATQAQMIAAALMRQDLSPWTQSGGAAQSRLNQYLGIGGVGSSGVTSMGLATGLSPDQVRQQLMSRYTRQSTAPNAGPMYRNGQEAIAALGPQGAAEYFQSRANQGASSQGGSWVQGNGDANDGVHADVWRPDQQSQGPGSTIDEEGLSAAIAKYYEEQKAQEDALKADPTYGSLLRAYRNGEEFSFTGKDLASDPGYQFGLNQGTQGIERGQAARGNFLSGAAMKELNRFNQDYAGTKFDNAFTRNLNTWNTNQNAYDSNRSRIFSFLTGVSTLGQNSAAQVGASNQQAAGNIGNNMLASGNMQAAGQVASGNAWQSGLNSAVNSINSAGGWNNLLANNTGRSGNNYSGSSGNMLAPNYENGMDRGVTW